MTDEDVVADVWKLVDGVQIVPLLRANDLTVQRFAERKKCTEAIARNELAKLVREGKLVKVVCRTPSGAHPVAYRIKKGKA